VVAWPLQHCAVQWCAGICHVCMARQFASSTFDGLSSSNHYAEQPHVAFWGAGAKGFFAACLLWCLCPISFTIQHSWGGGGPDETQAGCATERGSQLLNVKHPFQYNFDAVVHQPGVDSLYRFCINLQPVLQVQPTLSAVMSFFDLLHPGAQRGTHDVRPPMRSVLSVFAR
jgi:hypothetical protein